MRPVPPPASMTTSAADTQLISAHNQPPDSAPDKQSLAALSPPETTEMTGPVRGSHKYMYLSLVILVVQNTTLVLVMRYSRTVTVSGRQYLPTTAVVMSELLKLVVCSVMVFYGTHWNFQRGLMQLYTEIVQKKGEMLKVSVPSILYTFQNNLLYLALTYLDAATFQVTYQLKILTTALFSVVILHRSLSILKWTSLVLLTIAVALVQLSSVEEEEPAGTEEEEDGSVSVAVAGLLAVSCASITSGLAGVYTEMIMKGSDTSMWIRNVQLSLFSFIIGLVGVCVRDGEAVLEQGFFQGYSPVVGITICLQALGGIVVAAVIKYADNILKGFAAAMSIVFSSFISYFLLGDFYPTTYFLLGILLLIASTALYNWPQSSADALPTHTLRSPKPL